MEHNEDHIKSLVNLYPEDCARICNALKRFGIERSNMEAAEIHTEWCEKTIGVPWFPLPNDGNALDVYLLNIELDHTKYERSRALDEARYANARVEALSKAIQEIHSETINGVNIFVSLARINSIADSVIGEDSHKRDLP